MSLTTGRNMSKAAATAATVGAYAAKRAVDNLIDRYTKSSGPTVVIEEKRAPRARFNGSQYSSAPRSRRRRRRGGGSRDGVVMNRSNPPVALGWTVSSNGINGYGACSRFGMRGVRMGGSQFYCFVNTNAAGSGAVLQTPDTVGAAGNFNVGFFTHPSTLNRQVNRVYLSGGAGTFGFPQSQDPLFTHSITFTHYLFTKLRFMYLSKVGSNTAGSVSLAWTTDVNQLLSIADVLGASACEKHAISTTGNCWETQKLDATPMLRKDRPFLTNGDFTNLSQTFIESLTQGIFLASQDGCPISTNLGRIMMSYEIELYDERPYPTTFSAVSGT